VGKAGKEKRDNWIMEMSNIGKNHIGTRESDDETKLRGDNEEDGIIKKIHIKSAADHEIKKQISISNTSVKIYFISRREIAFLRKG
jgi:hypothetical protein